MRRRTPELPPDSRFHGTLEFRELLGEGATAEVWLARRIALEGPPLPCAAKVYRAGSALEGARREVEALAALNHPHVVRLIDYDLAAGLLLTEWIDGLSLREVLDRVAAAGVALPTSAALEIGRALCAGLQGAHEIGEAGPIVHRDVKPSNVMIDRQGFARLLDFGIASGGLGSSGPPGGDRQGTPGYWAPEQARGEAPTPASDIYSVGIVLLELSGLNPETPAASVARLREREPALGQLVADALSPDPESRPTAREARRRLARLARGAPGGEHLSYLVETVLGVDPKEPPPPGRDWLALTRAFDTKAPRRPTASAAPPVLAETRSRPRTILGAVGAAAVCAVAVGLAVSDADERRATDDAPATVERHGTEEAQVAPMEPGPDGAPGTDAEREGAAAPPGATAPQGPVERATPPVARPQVAAARPTPSSSDPDPDVRPGAPPPQDPASDAPGQPPPAFHHTPHAAPWIKHELRSFSVEVLPEDLCAPVIEVRHGGGSTITQMARSGRAWSVELQPPPEAVGQALRYRFCCAESDCVTPDWYETRVQAY